MPYIAEIVCAEDHPYFEESRERWLGVPVDRLRLQCDEALAALRDRHEPARRRLAEDLFLSGDEPA